MIGVICADSEKRAVREFFELFKTPWMFWDSSACCDVLVVASAGALPESFTGRLVVAFGATEMRGDASLGIAPRSRTDDAVLETDDLQLPLYTGALTLAADATILGRQASSGASLIVRCVTRFIACYPVRLRPFL